MFRKNNRKITMQIDRQIHDCQNRIDQLEQMKLFRINHPEENETEALPGGEGPPPRLEEIERRLEENYRQVSILKIRRMMGYD